MVRFKTDALTWISKNGFYSLKSNHETLISIRFLHASIQEFVIGKSVFVCTRKGFWNPSYTVTENNEFFLSMKHQFWGSNASIVLFDQQQFIVQYCNNPYLSISISHQNDMVMQYSLVYKNQQPTLQVQFGNSLLNADLLLALAAVCFILFKQIAGEYILEHEDLIGLSIAS